MAANKSPVLCAFLAWHWQFSSLKYRLYRSSSWIFGLHWKWQHMTSKARLCIGFTFYWFSWDTYSWNSASIMWGSPGHMEMCEKESLWDHSRPSHHLTHTTNKTFNENHPNEKNQSLGPWEKSKNIYCCFNPLIF